jgi:hypothetical protein
MTHYYNIFCSLLLLSVGAVVSVMVIAVFAN